MRTSQQSRKLNVQPQSMPPHLTRNTRFIGGALLLGLLMAAFWQVPLLIFTLTILAALLLPPIPTLVAWFAGLLLYGLSLGDPPSWLLFSGLTTGLVFLVLYQRKQLEQRQADQHANLEHAYFEKQAMLAAVLSMPIGVSISDPHDPDQRIAYANPALLTISGYPPEELIGRSSLILAGAASDPAGIAAMQQALAERRSFQIVLNLRRWSGEMFWCEITLNPVYHSNGSFVGMIGLYQDINTRRSNEQRLRTLEYQLNLILRTIPEQFWLKDVAGRYLLVSQALAHFHCLEPAAMLGKTAHEIYEHNLAEFITAGDQDVILNGRNYYAERLISAPNGKYEWFDSSRTPAYNDQGEVIGLIGLARNISMRKANEADLARQLRYAEALSRCSQVLLTHSDFSGDPAGSISAAIEHLRDALEVSRVVVYRYGQRNSDSHIERLAEISDPADPPLLIVPIAWGDAPPELSAAILARQPYGGPVAERFQGYPEFQAMFDRNDVKSWLMIPIAIGEAPWGHIGVSERRRARDWDALEIQLLTTVSEMIAAFVERIDTLKALHHRETHLQALRDAMPDTLFTLHADERVSDVHVGLDRYLLSDPGDSLPLTLTQVLSEPAVGALRAAAQSAWATQNVQRCELSVEGDDGLAVYEAQLVPISASELLVVAHDITERQQVAAQLRRAAEAAEAADRAKSTFLAHMSHEIRTPLNAVIGMTEVLRTLELPPDARESVDTIAIGGETLLGIVNDIIDLARIESGHIQIEEQPFDVAETIEAAVALIRQRAHMQGLSLQVTIDPAVPPMIYGDAIHVRQILVNLLANAVKFTPQGFIALSAEIDDGAGRIRIDVRDSGIGIAADQIQAIFGPFVRADDSRTSSIGGSGLGLTISRQLAERMGGSLHAESVLNQGSHFRLELPLRAATAPRLRETHPVRGDRQRRLLVVEDNPINQLVIDSLLRKLGYTATIAGSGEEALKLLEHSGYDIILMDIQLPGMSGIAATEAIRARDTILKQPQIIALTASALSGDRERYLAAGMNDYLTKPIRLDQLRAMLESNSPPGTE